VGWACANYCLLLLAAMAPVQWQHAMHTLSSGGRAPLPAPNKAAAHLPSKGDVLGCKHLGQARHHLLCAAAE
jgi:hypothetical protein